MFTAYINDMPCYTLGILTLGQTPREDILPTFKAVLGPKVNYLQAGALDTLSLQELEVMRPAAENTGIETRLLSGASILVRKDLLIENLKEKATKLERRCDSVLLLCSGYFPELKLSHPNLIQPIDFLKPVVIAIAKEKCLCIIGPESDMALAPTQWQGCAKDVITAPSSPYSDLTDLNSAALSAREGGADLIFMDDMGFTEEQRLFVRKISGISTMNATSMSARIISELL